MCHRKVIHLFVSCAFTLCYSATFDSPCPTVFQYKQDIKNIVYGDIVLYSNNNNLIQLDVQMSVPNRLDQGDSGRLELAFSKEKIVNDIIKGRPIHYYLYFPYWEQYPPKIMQIILNGVTVCSGIGYNVEDVPIVTTVTLQHVLTTNINQVLKNTRSVISDVPTIERSITPNKYDLNSNVDVYYIDFKPKMPQDPTKIYANNPFLVNKNANNFVDESPKLYEQRFRFNPFVATPSTIPANLDEAAINYRSRNLHLTSTDRSVYPQQTNFASNNDVCGKTIRGNHLIANGSTVPRNTYPWLVAMYKIMESYDNFTCGGTLVSKRHVVTAAHCLRPNGETNLQPEEVIVALGRHNIFSRNEGITIEPQQFYVHEDYRSRSKDADIAVVLLKIDAPFSDLIRPICLWNEPDYLGYILGDKGVVVGWGRDEKGAYLTTTPREINMPIVSLEQCHSSNDFFKRVATTRTFCAGNRDGSGPCNGDSGSGLILLRNGRWTLRGVVSMSILNPIASGLKCDLNEYIVFTDVAKFSNWLNSIIRQFG